MGSTLQTEVGGLGLQEISWEGDWSVVREGGRPTKWEGDPGSGRETNQRQTVSGLWAFHFDAKFSVGKRESCYWLETAVNTETYDMQDLHCRRAIFVCLYTGRCVIDRIQTDETSYALRLLQILLSRIVEQ